MIIQLPVYWIFFFFFFEKNKKKKKLLIAADLSKQKARAIQQIIFTGNIKATVANTRVLIYNILQ